MTVLTLKGQVHQTNGRSLSPPNQWLYSKIPNPHSAAVWIIDNPTQEIDLGVSQRYVCVLERSLVKMYEISLSLFFSLNMSLTCLGILHSQIPAIVFILWWLGHRTAFPVFLPSFPRCQIVSDLRSKQAQTLGFERGKLKGLKNNLQSMEKKNWKWYDLKLCSALSIFLNMGAGAYTEEIKMKVVNEICWQ